MLIMHKIQLSGCLLVSVNCSEKICSISPITHAPHGFYFHSIAHILCQFPNRLKQHMPKCATSTLHTVLWSVSSTKGCIACTKWKIYMTWPPWPSLMSVIHGPTCALELSFPLPLLSGWCDPDTVQLKGDFKQNQKINGEVQGMNRERFLRTRLREPRDLWGSRGLHQRATVICTEQSEC